MTAQPPPRDEQARRPFKGAALDEGRCDAAHLMRRGGRRGPGNALGATTELKADTWLKEFNCPFTATGTDSNAVIVLDLGASEAAVELSKVQLLDLTTGVVVMSTDPAWRPRTVKMP